MTRTMYIAILFATLTSCTPINECRKILCEADSLRSEGTLYADSTGIADVVDALGRCKYLYPAEYARANYYYGRLLRERNNYVDAMRCFINASHTDPHTPFSRRIGIKHRKMSSAEYLLLGNVYSNMASLAHMSGDYELSYDKYCESERCFRLAKDSTHCYYAYYNMAFELAMQKKKTETILTLNNIESTCIEPDIIALVDLTYAALYCLIAQYDSAIYYANRELATRPDEPTGYVIKAQSFWHLEQYDSAISIAKYVMDMPTASEGDQSNMLYILTYNDDNIDKEQVKVLSEQRTDIEIEQITPQKNKLAQAILILNQDMNSKPNYISICLVICIIFTSITLYLKSNRKHKQTQQIRQDIAKERRILSTHIKEHEEKKKELIKITQEEKEKQQNLQHENTILLQRNLSHMQKMLQTVEKHCSALRHSANIKKELSWNDYDKMREIVDNYFFMLMSKLIMTNKLTEREIQFCILVLIGLSRPQIADIMNYSVSGIGKFKYMVAKKLNTTGAHLREYLMQMSIGQL